MRVLIVHNILWAHYKAALFTELAKQCPSDSQLLVLQFANNEYKYQQLGKSGMISHDYPYILLHRGPLEEVTFSSKVRFVLKHIKTFKPDLVNVTGYYDPAFWIIILICKLKGIKLVMSNESGEKDGTRNGLKEVFKRFLISCFHGFIFFGKSSSKYIFHLGANPSQIITQHAAVINTSVVKSRFEQAKHTRTASFKTTHHFIFTGRLAQEKNVSLLIRAFSWLKQNDSFAEHWGLLIVGDGPLREKFISQTSEKDIHWLGGHPWHEVPVYLALADALVLPSFFEPWGLVVNEAMTCGLPVLVSSQCGCVEDLVENGGNGYTFDPMQIDSLIRVMQEFIHLSQKKRDEMGNRSLELISPFSEQRAANEIWEGFKRIIHP
ncbi:MAG: glycosyltransferase family 4 protein [Siphonobacter sp.]